MRHRFNIDVKDAQVIYNLINKKGLEINNEISSLDVALDPAVVLYGKPNEQVKVIHEKLQSITGIPMIERRLIYCGGQLQWEKIPEFIVNLFVPAAYTASPSKFYTTGRNVSSYLNESHDILAKEPCPFKKLEHLHFIPSPNTPAIELLESLNACILKKCPEAVVDAMYRSSTVIGVACKNTKFAVSGNMSQLE